MLTVLSYGIGQDSWAILVKLVFDAAFRQRYAPGQFLVVAADTGDEHKETYAHAEYTKQFCARHGIEFVHITKDMGFHSATWQSLPFYFASRNSIASKAYPKTCTDNLKIQPIYRFLEAYVGKQFGYEIGRKNALKQYAADHGKIRVLIGIARGEERRLGTEDPTVWQRQCLVKEYPLCDVGMDRADCQAYLRSMDEPVPPPSNCVMCPYKSKIEVLWTHRRMPEAFASWVAHEARKIAHWAGRVDDDKNLGVNGKKLLPQVLEEAITEFGHLSDADLDEYRMSHGHLCGSKY